MSVSEIVGRRAKLLRVGDKDVPAEVTNIELFFDLVYVFAFTQLSGLLYSRHGWTAIAQAAVIFVALWWSWSYTAWAMGLLDPERVPVAALLVILMLLSLVMAGSLINALHASGGAFALAYVAIQLLRGGFIVGGLSLGDPLGRSHARLLGWSLLSGVFWIGGAQLHSPQLRLAVWAAAAATEVLAPAVGFRLPGAGTGGMAEWRIAGGHLAERCQLLLMIAFGESFLRIGESWVHRDGSVAANAAFVLGFLLVVLLWSIYFLHHAEHGARSLEQAGEDAGRLARSAYLYAHAALVGGVILIAVAIHRTIEEPALGVSWGYTALCVGGPALFMAGLSLSKRWLGHGRGHWLLVGVGLLVVAGVATAPADQLAQLAAVTFVAAVLAVRAQLGE